MKWILRRLNTWIWIYGRPVPLGSHSAQDRANCDLQPLPGLAVGTKAGYTIRGENKLDLSCIASSLTNSLVTLN